MKVSLVMINTLCCEVSNSKGTCCLNSKQSKGNEAKCFLEHHFVYDVSKTSGGATGRALPPTFHQDDFPNSSKFDEKMFGFGERPLARFFGGKHIASKF